MWGAGPADEAATGWPVDAGLEPALTCRRTRHAVFWALLTFQCLTPSADAAARDGSAPERPPGAEAAALALLQLVVIAGLLPWRPRRAIAVLTERLRFEALLSGFAAWLVPASLRDVDVEIEAGLGQVAEFLRMDRACLDELAPGRGPSRLRWGADGPGTPMPVIEAAHFPWTAGRLREGQIVRFSCLDELPEEATVDRRSYEAGGTRSYLSLPLRADGSRALLRTGHHAPDLHRRRRSVGPRGGRTTDRIDAARVVLGSEDPVLSALGVPAAKARPGGSLKEVPRPAREAEYPVLGQVLTEVRWNRGEAARRLKVSYKTLLGKVRVHDLQSPRVGEGGGA